ncbi:MAG: ATP-binding cassette domain-containing protein [Myxococcota bacterium]
MVKDLEALMRVVDGGDRARRRLWFANVVIAVAGDFGLVYWQIVALERQRCAQPYRYEASMFALSIIVWFLGNRALWGQTGRGLAEGTEALLERIVERLRRLPLDRFETLGRGDLIVRLTGDTQRLVTAARALIGGPVSLLRLGLGAVFAFLIAPSVAGVAAAAMVLMGVAIAAQMKVMFERFGRIAEEEVRLYDLLRGHVEGAIPLKLHRPRSRAVTRALAAVSGGLRALRVGLYAVFFERQHAANAILYAVLGVNVFLLPLLVQTDNSTIRDVNLVLVWVVFSVLGIVFTLPELTGARSALERLHELDAQLAEATLEPAVTALSCDPRRYAGFDTLSVHGLQFRYPPSDGRPGFSVGPIDLEFSRGEVVFITGYNGAGKSTFLKMLTGLYPAAAGEITVDGAVITAEELADYRTLFSTIFTDHHLFAQAFGLDDTAVERAGELLEQMEIAHKTSIVDGRISNRALSTGQKKRLAMVLARLQDRPVLIFDEWAADQDPEFRAIYYQRILPALRADRKLVIAVTHDDQYFHCADRVIHCSDGRFETGPPPPPPSPAPASPAGGAS